MHGNLDIFQTYEGASTLAGSREGHSKALNSDIPFDENPSTDLNINKQTLIWLITLFILMAGCTDSEAQDKDATHTVSAQGNTQTVESSEITTITPEVEVQQDLVKTILHYIDNPNEKISIDTLALSFVDEDLKTKQVVIGEPNYDQILQQAGVPFVDDSSETIGYVLDYSMPLFGPMNPGRFPFAVDKTTRDVLLGAYIYQGFEGGFSMSIIINELSENKNSFTLQNLLFTKNEPYVGHVKKNFTHDGSVYTFEYSVDNISPSGQLSMLPHYVARAGEVETREYFAFRFYLAGTEREEGLFDIDEYVADIDYKLLLDPKNHEQIAREMDLPVELISQVADQVEKDLNNPFNDLSNVAPDLLRALEAMYADSIEQ